MYHRAHCLEGVLCILGREEEITKIHTGNEIHAHSESIYSKEDAQHASHSGARMPGSFGFLSCLILAVSCFF